MVSVLVGIGLEEHLSKLRIGCKIWRGFVYEIAVYICLPSSVVMLVSGQWVTRV